MRTDSDVDPLFAPATDVGARFYDVPRERSLVALALFAARPVRAQAQAALMLVPPTCAPLRTLAMSHVPTTYEEMREMGLVRREWPNGFDVLELLDHLRALAMRRALLRRALELAEVARDGSDDEVRDA